MPKNGEPARVKRYLDRLIRERERQARIFILMAQSGRRVDTVESADVFIREMFSVSLGIQQLDNAIASQYRLGFLYGFLTEPLAEYVRRVGEQETAV